ncbi:MAG: RES family NAD+ phosphorylase [Candidatus Caenarcaniphilales bacterium]|nr:RES family NAD+ phosphorylase [Candidatus Caenarcaniphilales bacterium]
MRTANVDWQPCYRIIPSRYPPISIYERVSVSDEFELLVALESQTNPRLKNEINTIYSNPSYGQGVGYVMAAFTHLNPEGSRFSDGNYGVYYTAKNEKTAIEETKYHREKFYRATNNPKKLSIEMRVLIADLKGDLEDLRILFPENIFAPDDYSNSQKYAKDLKTNGSNGILYLSVRHLNNEAAAVFNPSLLSNCRTEKHLVYEWNGKRIHTIYEKKIYF